MIALISGGASVGAIARPLGKSVAFPCGWNSGSVGLVPPVPVPTPPVAVSAKATAGSAHASKHASAAKQYRMCAGSPDILFRPPAELADGLALKELARFLERKFAPTNWFPRSGQARIRHGVTVANGQASPFVYDSFLMPTWNFISNLVGSNRGEQRALLALARNGSRSEWTFAEVREISSRFAGALQERGGEKGAAVLT